MLSLLRAHASLGERSHALRVYHRFADRMRRRLEGESELAPAYGAQSIGLLLRQTRGER